MGGLGVAVGREHDAGVVEQHVEPAEVLDGRVDHGPHLVLGGDVGGERLGPAARGGDLVGHRVGAVVVAVDAHDGGSLARHESGRVGPDATGRTGDDGHLPLELH